MKVPGKLARFCLEDFALSSIEDQLNALEQRRLAALSERDAAVLQSILADDYIHVHGTGRLDDRASFIQGILDRPRKSARGPLAFQVYGELAVMRGEQTNQAPSTEGSLSPLGHFMATQVAHRESEGWRFVSMHVTQIGPLPASVQRAIDYPAQSDRLTAQQTELIALERRRAAAIANKDFKALAEVLAEDYVHVYGDGRSSGKAGYLEQVRTGPRVPTRGPLTVRIYGDSAVLTGDLLNRIEYPDKPQMVLDTFVTQVARRIDGDWKFVAFQITPKRAIA